MTGRGLARKLKLTPQGEADLAELTSSAHKGRLKQVRKILGFMETNLEHPSLNTHELESLRGQGPDGGKVYEAYAQNETPGAYRVLFSYGNETEKNRRVPILWIIAIVPHL